jgi:hypothetical protein
MLMRYPNLAILASTALSQKCTKVSQQQRRRSSSARGLQLGHRAGRRIPQHRDDANEESEVIFKYNFTGTLSARNYLGVTLYHKTASQTPAESLAFVKSTNGDELDVELDIIQETISNSVQYLFFG